jgi:hypothetical protein
MRYKSFGILVLSVFLLFSSCSVNYSFVGVDIGDAKTVTIKYFTNNAALTNPIFPQQLTEGLKDIFLQQTRLDLQDKNGDLIFEGSIDRYDVAPAAIQSGEQASLNRLTVSVSVTFTNTIKEQDSFETSFSRFADFPGNQDLSQVESTLMDEIIEQLTQDILNKALGNW